MFVLIYNVDYFRSFIYGNNLSNTDGRVTQLYSDLKMSQHTISMVTAYDSFATIVRQRCYIDNK